ncbi:MAG: hypothetical protein R3319_04385, partial [Candidatus Bathyarchaeia archaeon]|nr:hypothetical protein [Candidatus Bathyarchaeia archaeon]
MYVFDKKIYISPTVRCTCGTQNEKRKIKFLIESAISGYEDNISDMGGDIYTDESNEYAEDIADSKRIIAELKAGKYDTIEKLAELMGASWVETVLE